MPNNKSTWKRLRQDKKRQQRNVDAKSRMRSRIKKLRAACAGGDRESAQAQLIATLSLIDRAGQQRMIHPRQANRRKSRLQKLLNKMEA